MKKTLLTIGIVAALFSCSKEDDVTLLEATDLTGQTIVQGSITRKDVSNNDIALADAKVTIRVENEDLYPNSRNAKGSQVYTGVSDAAGNYSISVTTNGQGVTARITYSPVTLIADPSTGKKDTYSSTSTTTTTLYTGVTATFNRNYSTANNVDISDVIVETAIVKGTLEIEHWVQQDSLTSTVYQNEALPLANYKVVLTYDQDPTTLQKREYEVMTDANGVFSFTVETADFDYNLDNDYRISVPDYNTTKDSILFNNSILSSTPGVFAEESRTGAVEGGNVDNAKDLFYNNFTKD